MSSTPLGDTRATSQAAARAARPGVFEQAASPRAAQSGTQQPGSPTPFSSVSNQPPRLSSGTSLFPLYPANSFSPELVDSLLRSRPSKRPLNPSTDDEISDDATITAPSPPSGSSLSPVQGSTAWPEPTSPLLISDSRLSSSTDNGPSDAPFAPSSSAGSPLSSACASPTWPEPISSVLSALLSDEWLNPYSDSDQLSSAPDSPVWPETPALCIENDCPVKIPHYRGAYLHKNEPPREQGGIFGDSNPPPRVWASAEKIQTAIATIDDDMIVLAFLRYHVESTGTMMKMPMGGRNPVFFASSAVH
ncbi:hypothetical protein MMC28_008821 [Mycoblastus sanguinarius]|nr:hypothetical protein [Mycoblastus sanguinarius]